MGFTVEVAVGSLILGLSFVFKDLFINICSGIWLRASDELNVGDKLRDTKMPNGETIKGRVLDVGLRNTHIMSENQVDFVPNEDVFKAIVRKKPSSIEERKASKRLEKD